jgi:hypothetical protein
MFFAALLLLCTLFTGSQQNNRRRAIFFQTCLAMTSAFTLAAAAEINATLVRIRRVLRPGFWKRAKRNWSPAGQLNGCIE